MARPRKRKYKFIPYGLRGQFASWDEFQEANIKLPCSNPSCTRLRHNRSKWCATCGRWFTMFGDAKLRPIKPAQYKKYIDQAKEVIAFNPSSIVITDFCEKWETLADHGRQELPIEQATWWAGIYKMLTHKSKSHRKDAKTVLAYLTGLYMFYGETGNEIIKTEKMYHFTIADIAMKGCKLSVLPKCTGLRMRKFGRFLWGAFSIYWLKLAYAIQANERLKKIREQKLKEAKLQLPEDEKE
jgi:hypothetical protein